MIFLIFLDNFASTDLVASLPFLQKLLNWFSTEVHFSAFSQGLFSLSDLVFFISITLVVLVWTIIIIEKRRWSRG